jgi:hypothetical protein
VEDLLKLQWELHQDGVEAALEKSRRGAHLWIFAEEPLLARDCRIYIYNLATRLRVPVKGGAGLAEGASIAHVHGVPGMPGWAEWSAGELNTRHALIPAPSTSRAPAGRCTPTGIRTEGWIPIGTRQSLVALRLLPQCPRH